MIGDYVLASGDRGGRIAAWESGVKGNMVRGGVLTVDFSARTERLKRFQIPTTVLPDYRNNPRAATRGESHEMLVRSYRR